MLSFDKKFALLRRRLIQSLRYLKMYAEHIDVEYTDEEFEVNVRPSLPFSTLGEINGEASIAFYKVNSARSTPTVFNGVVEIGSLLKAGESLAYPLQWDLKSSITSSGLSLNELTLLKPLGFDAKTFNFNSGFQGNVDFVRIIGIDTKQNLTNGFEAKTSFIKMPHIISQINVPVDAELAAQFKFINPLLLEGTLGDIEIKDNFKVSLQYIRPIAQWSVDQVGDLDVTVQKIMMPRLPASHDLYSEIDFTPQLFQYTTMETLGDKTLAELDDMPTEVGYILVTYTENDYPWEV